MAAHLGFCSRFHPFKEKFEEADPLYLRAIEMGEKALGPGHPALARQLNNRAGLLTKQVRVQKMSHDFCVWKRIP